MKFSEYARIESVLLQRLQFVSTTQLDSHFLRSTKFLEPMIADAADSMILRMITEIAGQTHTVVEERFPTTWWDAVKNRWVPAWAREFVRINYTIIRVDQQTLFPSVVIPRHEPVIRVEVVRTSLSLPYSEE